MVERHLIVMYIYIVCLEADAACSMKVGYFFLSYSYLTLFQSLRFLYSVEMTGERAQMTCYALLSKLPHFSWQSFYFFFILLKQSEIVLHDLPRLYRLAVQCQRSHSNLQKSVLYLYFDRFHSLLYINKSMYCRHFNLHNRQKHEF